MTEAGSRAEIKNKPGTHLSDFSAGKGAFHPMDEKCLFF
jgi:hypothetical protein